METDARDYLYATSLIGIVLATTTALLLAIEGQLAATLGAYAVIVIFVLALLFYGGFTALLLAVVARWRPLVEGDYAKDHAQFTLWKVQHVVGELGKVALVPFFPVFARAAFYSLFGAQVGKQVAVAGKLLDPRLVILGDGCVLGEGCIVAAHTMIEGRFILRAVRVGPGATVGVGSILMPGVNIGAGAVVLPGSVLKAGTEVPARETWGGVPARRIKSAADSIYEPPS